MQESYEPIYALVDEIKGTTKFLTKLIFPKPRVLLTIAILCTIVLAGALIR